MSSPSSSSYFIQHVQMRLFFGLLSVLGLMSLFSPLQAEPENSKWNPGIPVNRNLEWPTDREWRLLVEVPPRKLANRNSDESPAELQIDLAGILSEIGFDQLPDLNSVQVMKIDPEAGKPEKYSDYRYGQSAYDRPFRWYDDAIPYEFPEFRNTIDRTKGKITYQKLTRTGYFGNVLGDWRSGRLVWNHSQVEDQLSFYTIYFDLLPPGKKPARLPPRGWMGDGVPRCDLKPHSTLGVSHVRIDVDDWNEDGLEDLIVGEAYGHLTWWPNVGTKQKPEYRFAKHLLDANNTPIDAGMSAAPHIVDWNGDGLKDLLVGTEWNRIIYYENNGSHSNPQLQFRGVLKLGEEPLALPFKPLARGKEEIFKRDYYPVLETVDWDHDGDLDLLAGGYVTGRIFWYENTGTTATGEPVLQFNGALEADGKPLNVGHWCAAPTVADFDADGDLDLMTGNMPMYLKPEEQSLHEDDFLQYYENIGTRENPTLTAKSFPHSDQFPRGRLATPRATDLDQDGDLDLAVSSGQNIYLFFNTGSKSQPVFTTQVKPVTVPWGTSSIDTGAFLDWDGDGKLDLVNGYTIRLNSGIGNPYQWNQTVNVLPDGKQIAHPSGIGDDWFWPKLNDFDQDGKIDVLFGDWSGNIWFHRNLSENETQFDLTGFRLQLINGEILKVGPVNKDINKNFDALQGARTVFAVDDFNGDGFRDLIVGDTYGIIRYFENAGESFDQKTNPRFKMPVVLGNLGIRGLVDSCDWNNDGHPDVVASAANGKVQIFVNKNSSPNTTFEEGLDPGLPPIEQPRSLVADLNGDGDNDLYIPSTQGSCFVERSFLADGYAKGILLRLEPSPSK